ncbi:carboxyl-terminal processing protease [Thermolongibacillus altinsuensis]|uniref:C-terminal processing peptidase n=1 Tax=Thermolongibacillus altinsuensis TaxID=575256 RepID=A0A4R1QC06_9BACL|nr:S41 family peptidase [Thermolongibacillus altinsuensis]TCL47703.1 carboxyl-terminal processing protease [Thermolongibacillus altinsuensis]
MNKKTTAALMALSMFIGSGATYAGMHLFANPSKEESTISIQSPAIGTSSEEELEKVEQAYKLIKEKYVEKVDDEQLIEGAIQGMLATLKDPYSVYMDQETASRFNESLDSSFEGIGAEVSMVDGKVTIVAPFKGSPAEKAGLRPNDQIIKVNGESLEGLDLYEAVLKIRGKKGTTVRLEVIRPGVSGVLKIDVVRDEIPIETVYDSVKTYEGKKIGYLEITSFAEKTAQDFKEKLAKLEKQGIEGLVLDVRGNPGGYLQSVEEILKELVPKDKPYVQIEERDGNKQRYFSTLTKKKDYPIVVLVDNGSASASEILAAALKEAGGYPLVGEKTFGKGTVQQAVPMEDGSNIKLTLYKWLTPNGNWIHQKGIKPDVEVKQPDFFYAHPLQIEQALAYDMNNEQIKSAQQMLKGLGFDPGREDGYFSKETEQAVKAFQKANGLPVTGKINQNTASVLQTKVMEAVRDEKYDEQLKEAIKLAAKK